MYCNSFFPCIGFTYTDGYNYNQVIRGHCSCIVLALSYYYAKEVSPVNLVSLQPSQKNLSEGTVGLYILWTSLFPTDSPGENPCQVAQVSLDFECGETSFSEQKWNILEQFSATVSYCVRFTLRKDLMNASSVSPLETRIACAQLLQAVSLDRP